MATLFFDGDRLVLDFMMCWIREASMDGKTIWSVADTDEGDTYFPTKEAARAHLAKMAAEG